MKIRRAVPEDAEAYGQLRSAVLLESEFMLREPGEYQFEAGELARQLEAVSGSGNSVVLLAHGDEDLVGFAAAAGGALSRTRHVAGIVMAVRREYWGQGIGRALLAQVCAWARDAHLYRLELNVAVSNERAVALYQSAGFVIEGVRRAAVMCQGRYEDDYAMALLLDGPGTM
ncbi:MAG: GNAT family N-acetyltransferase [bacterium]|nr:GNAT family N-acetyltransferase [bacterium]